MIIEAYRCVDCDTLTEQPEGPLWECSRCSGRQVGEDENRCADCHIFMAKEADLCCPYCESSELEEVSAWRGASGELFASEQAEKDWQAQAPEREATSAKSRASLDAYLAEMSKAAGERNARLLPRLRTLLALLGEHCPRLRSSIQYNIDDIERDPEAGGTVTAMLYFEELASMLAPDLSAELALARDYSMEWAERDRAEATIRDRIRSALPPVLTGRMVGSMFSAGSGIGFDMVTVTEALIPVLEQAAAAPVTVGNTPHARPPAC